MGHSHSGERLSAEKAEHNGDTDPGVLSTSPSPKLDEIQELTEIQENVMDNLKQIESKSSIH